MPYCTRCEIWRNPVYFVRRSNPYQTHTLIPYVKYKTTSGLDGYKYIYWCNYCYFGWSTESALVA